MNVELERKLVAIMFTDMVGYTALMQHDESMGLIKRNRHKSVIKEQHRKFNGDIIQYFGDGTLSIFYNSVDAVQCAIEIQKAFKNPINIPLRIGIHVGNVIIQEDGIIGDAVNIASRIESFANPGGVLVSDAVHDQLLNQPYLDFIDLGKFKLKNVERPFDIFAVSSEGLVVPNADFLQGKGEKIVAFKTHLPTTTTPILGRGKEVKEIVELLQSHNLVTITGTGGIGKTRLSLEISKNLEEEFKDGIVFISMANLIDAKEVMPSLAAALDIKEAEGRTLIEGVSALISDKKALLILDNLEHVISAANEIAELIGCCPNSKILCTSRTPLKITAEQEYSLNPFVLPETFDLNSLSTNPAIRLFVNRAKKVKLDFELTNENANSILEICRRVDGLPFAIELAAARIKILPPDKLLKRLSRALDLLTTGSRDIPKRHQTLRATIDWSHELLSESERKLFRRLSVFGGSFTLEAIESICYENEEDSFFAMDELESLLDKSLVKSEDNGTRFTLLQTINDFAKEKLEESGETELISQNHATYSLVIAEWLNKASHGVKQLDRMKEGALEEANIQIALDYLLKKAKTGDIKARELGLSILGELALYWHIRGKHKTGKQYINNFIGTIKDAKPGLGECKALFHLHVATFTLGEIEETKLAADKHQKLAKILGDELEMGKSYFSTGWGHFFSDQEKAMDCSEKAIEIFTRLQHDSWKGFALWQHAVINLSLGLLDKATISYKDALSLFQNIHNYEGIGCAQSGLAMVEFIGRNYDKAIRAYLSALAAFKSVGDRPEEARLLSEMSWVFLANKNTISARKYALDSIQAYKEVGSTRGIGLSMNGLAAIEAVEGYPEKAIQIASAAEHFAEQEGVVIEFGVNNHGKVYLQNAENKLSSSDIELAKNVGRTLSLQAVLEMATNEVLQLP